MNRPHLPRMRWYFCVTWLSSVHNCTLLSNNCTFITEDFEERFARARMELLIKRGHRKRMEIPQFSARWTLMTAVEKRDIKIIKCLKMIMSGTLHLWLYSTFFHRRLAKFQHFTTFATRQLSLPHLTCSLLMSLVWFFLFHQWKAYPKFTKK